jgi:hypothetical protein
MPCGSRFLAGPLHPGGNEPTVDRVFTLILASLIYSESSLEISGLTIRDTNPCWFALTWLRAKTCYL